MIFASYVRISNHMWSGPDSLQTSFECPTPYPETNDVDLTVWDDYVKYLAEHKFNLLLVGVADGVRLDSHPEIAAPDAWSKDFLREKLNEARAAGLEPIPELNLSAGHNLWQKKWRRLIGTPEYRRFCEEIIAEVAEIFDRPRFFQIGMDEEAYQPLDGVSMVRNEVVWWRDVYSHIEACEKAGTRPWVWSDYYWNHPDLFEKNMPKSVLQSNWYYREFRPQASRTYEAARFAYAKLDLLGYDQIPTCSCCVTPINPKQTMVECAKVISPEHLLGYMTAAWGSTSRENYHYMLHDAEHFYAARERFYPDTL